jgi:hypothetical protein
MLEVRETDGLTAPNPGGDEDPTCAPTSSTHDPQRRGGVVDELDRVLRVAVAQRLHKKVSRLTENVLRRFVSEEEAMPG